MASPTFDFDDQLSEDWISQPRSSEGARFPGNVQLRNSLQQSRIPLPTKPAVPRKHPAPPTSSARPSPRGLHIKSKSELNIPLMQNGPGKEKGSPLMLHSSSRSRSENHKRSSSAQSLTLDGTVQHFGSEIRHAGAGAQMTPEWKRRLLKGQDAGEQKDLFSPLGLENVFRPPSGTKNSPVVVSPKRRNSARTHAESSMVYPSSPPPYPSPRRRRTKTTSTSPSPFREHRHTEQCRGQGGKCEGAIRTPTPTKRQVRLRLSRQGSMSKESVQGPGDTRRVQSGASAAQHERISPVAMRNGDIDYKSIQKSIIQLREKMESLGLPEQTRPSSRSSDNGVGYDNGRGRPHKASKGLATESSATKNFSSFPKGSFVNHRRGGYSSDDNFHHRPLSPSSFQPDMSVAEPKSDNPTMHIHRPQTPRRDLRFVQSSPEKPRSGGSPLKLFGQHDTFTNDHLMRRLSQYVKVGEDDLSLSPEQSPSPKHQSDRYQLNISPKRGPRSLRASFGSGRLDGHTFPLHDSFLADQPDDDDPSLPPVLPPKEPFKFQVPVGLSAEPQRHASHAAAKRLATSQASQRVTRRPSLADFRQSIGDADLRSDGKRTLFISPSKDHSVKRRRTLRSSIGSMSGAPDRPPAGILIGKKRTDALPGETAKEADPEVIALRDILHPRSVSSPSLRRSSTSTMSSWLGANSSSRQVSQQVCEPAVDASVKVLAEDLANFALHVAKNITNGGRKASVTTDDFFKEANAIMQHLRGQVRSPSVRRSGETSLIDQMPEIEELDEESIRSLREIRARKEIAPNLGQSNNIAAHSQRRSSSKLNKFKEDDDLGLALGASVRNLEIAPKLVGDDGSMPKSDPNIRILDGGTQAAHDDMSHEDAHVRTRSSTGHSTNRSIRTGTSSNSSRKFNIAPETVKSLISDQVGRMIFDHQKGVWLRNREASNGSRPNSSHANSDNTEDDPLKNIPDLEDDSPADVHPGSQDDASSTLSSPGTVINNSRQGSTRNSAQAGTTARFQPDPKSRPSSGHGADSSQLSKFSKFGSSQTGPETRATSWSTVAPAKTQGAAAEPDLPQVEEVGEAPEGELGDHAILETEEAGDSHEMPTHPRMLSSPLHDVPDNVLFPPSSEPNATPAKATASKRAVSFTPLQEDTPIKNGKIASALARSKERAQRHLSNVRQRYNARPVSRIEELDEHQHGDLNGGLSGAQKLQSGLSAGTPLQVKREDDKALLVPPPSTDRRSSVGFHRSLCLDPLSDFTIHLADESLNLDVDYVMQRHNLKSRDEIDSRFSIAVQDLVARVTDIEPYEPYWEYIRNLDLSDKKLITLHMLEEFCCRIEDLKVSQNELGQLNGVPQTLKSLEIRSNCLTSLTAWGHLNNLQYLDVSGNQIDSLRGFVGLTHLRELIADDNQISGLDGIDQMPRLMKLSLRRNYAENIEAGEVELGLLELDLSENSIVSVSGIEHMPLLQALNLRQNSLRNWQPEQELPSLCWLDVADNNIDTLNTAQLPHLRYLNADNNCLRSVGGLGQLKYLDSLSCRSQRLATDEVFAIEEACEVRSLAVSGNRLNLQGMKHFFLNLNLLEMASCGLDALPNRFGILLPNLRYLNLNNNALRDIKSLSGIKKLKELHLAGNRISRLRNTATVLHRIGSRLKVVDIRLNPITLGFYLMAGGNRPESVATIGKASGLIVRPDSAAGKENVVSEQPLICRSEIVPLHAFLKADDEQDATHRSRLDEGTALRRRVYELLLQNSCPALTTLDGMSALLGRLGGEDEVWQRLVELKVVRTSVEDPS